ncbi:MAG: hypothetical protein D6E12_12750 [Desulfovibrio sp.]|nr:MAG: hypothetical protein D6E12_12750 [Desulfovibrio sp.]
MRVSMNQIYDSVIRNSNNSMAEIMRLTNQNSAQKTILRPSDDPLGWALAMNTRSYMERLDQYQENNDTAESWLSLGDDVLGQCETLTTHIRELAEQAATGTLTDEQRDLVATEAREFFEQLMAQSNTEYAGQSIFAGTYTDDQAYEMGLAATVMDDTLDDGLVLSVTGAAEQTPLIEFQSDGVTGVDGLNYRYSLDSGLTWTDATLAAGDTEIDLGSCRMQLAAGQTVSAPTNDASGTMIMLRPAAMYQGNGVSDALVTNLGHDPVLADAEGSFAGKTLVRIDADTTLAGTIEYSYSLDQGQTWVTGNFASNASLPIPGGFLNLASNAGSTLTASSQFAISLDDPEIRLDIGPGGDSVAINIAGCSVFGGRYETATGTEPVPGDIEDNLFETVGQLIGYMEINDIEGIGQCLDLLDTSHDHLATKHAQLGGRENRVTLASESVDMAEEAATQRLSDIEDADLTQVLTDLAREQTIYSAVLETSSQIMGMSLLNYI